MRTELDAAGGRWTASVVVPADDQGATSCRRGFPQTRWPPLGRSAQKSAQGQRNRSASSFQIRLQPPTPCLSRHLTTMLCVRSALTQTAQLKSVQLSVKHNVSAHLRMLLPLLLQAALPECNQNYSSSSFHRLDGPSQHLGDVVTATNTNQTSVCNSL
eukprot:COSAG02_NODE_7287_length_3084_cov_3.485427_2_plen_158_part_00